ncbi:MAG: hypothetical protein J1E95_01650 [Muribaculaceae bacterium]|nr:hypothetical protein [Muribaculaceae bacterium]
MKKFSGLLIFLSLLLNVSCSNNNSKNESLFEEKEELNSKLTKAIISDPKSLNGFWLGINDKFEGISYTIKDSTITIRHKGEFDFINSFIISNDTVYFDSGENYAVLDSAGNLTLNNGTILSKQRDLDKSDKPCGLGDLE